MTEPPTASPPSASPPTATLHIDLGAIAANWHALNARGPAAAIVKADAYGLGAAHIATRLYAEGCRHFFVAHMSEALPLRPLLPGAMLAVLNGLPPGGAPGFAAHSLAPVLGSLAEIGEWSAYARATGRTLPALLHVDTGMNRLGLPADELATLTAEPHRLAGIDILFVMSHLAAAEHPEDPANARQRDAFAAACAMLPAAPRSLANSAGSFLGDAYASDLARPGAALYGVNPTPGQPNPMRPVIGLRAPVLQLRTIPTGAAVGYNAQWTAARPSRIATIGVGYADGYPRALTNRAVAHFDEHALPLVGRISMDLSTFDATDAPGLRVGDWLDLVGPRQDVDAVAARAGTIGYEILTSLGRRYTRVYT